MSYSDNLLRRIFRKTPTRDAEKTVFIDQAARFLICSLHQKHWSEELLKRTFRNHRVLVKKGRWFRTPDEFNLLQ